MPEVVGDMLRGQTTVRLPEVFLTNVMSKISNSADFSDLFAKK